MPGEVDIWSLIDDELGWSRPDYTWNPVGWAESRGVFLWSKQREVLEALVKYPQVAVHAYHAAGKSFAASMAVLWWIDTRRPGMARAFSTAPTFHQVKAILWAEIGKLHARLDLPGRCNTTELIVPDESGKDFMAAWGRKPQVNADGSVGSAFQGIHGGGGGEGGPRSSGGVLIVGDEASGLPAGLIDDAERNLSSPAQDRMLLIGNPDDSTSMFARICRGEIPGWHVIHLDAYDSPNWTGEAVPPEVARALISKDWAAAQAAKWGESSPTYLARVRGIFPEDSSDAVVPASIRAKGCIPIDDPVLSPRVLGVDVGAGGDWTVCQLREGQRYTTSWRFRTRDPQATAQDIVTILADQSIEIVRIDSIGVGWGVGGALREALSRGQHHADVQLVNVSEASSEPKRFVNLRSELWWRARELCERGDVDLSGAPPDALEQLTWPRKSDDPRGRIRVERKDETILRHGHSPDDADALLLAMYAPVPAVMEVPFARMAQMGRTKL